MPTSSPVPLTVSPARSRRTSAPIVSRMSRIASPAWVVCCGQPGTRTRAAGHQRRREERRGVGQVGLDLDVEGVDLGRLDPPGVGLAVVDDRPGVAQRLDRHLDVRLARHRLAVVVDGDALVVARARRAAARRRTARRPRRRASPSRPASRRAVDGERAGRRARRPSTVGARATRRASSTGPIGRTRACGSPSNGPARRPGPRPAAGTA